MWVINAFWVIALCFVGAYSVHAKNYGFAAMCMVGLAFNVWVLA